MKKKKHKLWAIIDEIHFLKKKNKKKKWECK